MYLPSADELPRFNLNDVQKEFLQKAGRGSLCSDNLTAVRSLPSQPVSSLANKQLLVPEKGLKVLIQSCSQLD